MSSQASSPQSTHAQAGQGPATSSQADTPPSSGLAAASHPQTNQRIDGKRLWDTLMGFAEIGATPKRWRPAADPDRRRQAWP